MTTSSLLLLSGGQDSTVCLAWALDRYDRVETIGFAYGQRHEVELIARRNVLKAIRRDFPRWAGRLGDDHLLDLAEFGAISDSALTRETEIEMTASGLPSTFVPGRNLVFFTYAAAIAYRRGIRTLVGGMCETDFSGYPDCRNNTLQSLARTLSLGMAVDLKIETPLMWIDKAGTWQMAKDLGGQPLVDLIVEETHTCYLGERGRRRDWGYGCGTCPACDLRAKGWAKWTGRAG
jgi:7-cyano-7-deazaguanine synthase